MLASHQAIPQVTGTAALRSRKTRKETEVSKKGQLVHTDNQGTQPNLSFPGGHAWRVLHPYPSKTRTTATATKGKELQNTSFAAPLERIACFASTPLLGFRPRGCGRCFLGLLRTCKGFLGTGICKHTQELAPIPLSTFHFL